MVLFIIVDEHLLEPSLTAEGTDVTHQMDHATGLTKIPRCAGSVSAEASV
jgi:hypothetical protein